MSREEDERQARKGESPCNFSNPPGIYTFTRQIMKMKSQMENSPSQTGHGVFLKLSTAQLFPLLSMPQWVCAESAQRPVSY